jgi:CHAD domain-containing protein
MTPGLAGFVVSGTDTQTWDEVIAGVAAALGQGFAVVPERGGHVGARRRTWLDTFDWRLYRAGLILEYAAAHRGGELRLTSAHPAAPAAPSASTAPAALTAPAAPTAPTAPGATPGTTAQPATAGAAAQPVTGWRASSPHLLGDLPDGPVTARITGLVAPRALLPAVTVASTATVSRLLNDDGKTVARLLIECPAVANGQHAALPPRLTITEVRGYPGQARRAARIISGTAGVQPAAEPVFTDALRALGRRPGDYSNKVDANITAGMPAAKAVATIMLRLLDTIEVNLPGVLRDTDTEFLHDLRVSVRRTRSALKLFGDVLTVPAGGKARGTRLTSGDLARFAADFKWVGDLTTPTRDLDVHLLDFEETARALRAAKPDDLEPFRVYLEQRRIKEFRALARGLRSARFTKLTREWRTALTKVRNSSGNARTGATARSGQSIGRAGETAGTLAAERTRRAFTKVAKLGAAITPASPHESLHDLRKRCKELRYALEFFAPLYDPAAYGKVVGDLKRLQDCLGQFQDSEVQIYEIRTLAAAMQAANEAPAVTLLAMGEVTAGLAARQAAARADFERRFAAFAGPDGQRRMSVLLRGGAA